MSLFMSMSTSMSVPNSLFMSCPCVCIPAHVHVPVHVHYFLVMLAVGSAFSYNFSLHFSHSLSNVHTWAMFFLRHLANMSCMVPFWASTGSGFVPVWGGPRLKPRRPEKVVYSLNDSCLHFTQSLFPPKLPQQHTRLISYSTSTSFMLVIHHIYLHLLFYMSCSHIHFFGSSWQAGCSRLLVSDTILMAGHKHSKNMKALQKKKNSACPLPSAFIFFLFTWQRQFFSISPRASPTHTSKNFSRNFHGGCNHNIYRSQYFWRALFNKQLGPGF
jgi:hypothetical protein